MVDGEVELELGGKTETLRCTLRAAKAVNAISGGFTDIFRRLAIFDLDAYSAVVAAGLGKKPSEIEEAVYKAGVQNLTAPLVEFVGLLANGGKPDKPDKPKDDGSPPGEA